MRTLFQCSILFLVLVLPDQLSVASKILLMPFPWKSHVAEVVHIGEALVARGHEVHVMLPSHYSDIAKYRKQSAKIPSLEYTAKHKDFMFLSDSAFDDLFEEMLELPPIDDFRNNYEGFIEICYNVLEDKELEQKIINHKYDLILVDSFPYTRCYFIIPYKLDIPYVSVTTQYEPWLTRTPSLPSFVPFPLMVPPVTPQMTFVERLTNFWTLLDWTATVSNIPILDNEFVRKYAPNKPFVTIDYLTGRSKIFLFDTDISIDYPRPVMANEVYIGGLSVKQSKSLTGDFDKFVSGSKKGTIIASFGSSNALPEKYLTQILEAMKMLPSDYRVVLRWTFENKPAVPDNILLSKWVPQSDILGHPKTKVFLTHCGANSQFEALYHAVPMINFPAFGDQPYNAKRADYKGFSETVRVRSLTKEIVYETIMKVLNNDSYYQNIKKASDIFKSQPMTPSDRAAFWIEHVLKFGGDHLRSSAMELEWYQFLMLDIIGFILICFLLSFHILLYLCCKIKNKVCASSSRSEDNNNYKKKTN